MTPEGAIAPPSDASSTANTGTTTVVDTSATSGTTPPPDAGVSTGSATAGADQGELSTSEQDPLAGVPTLDELNKLDENAQYKKSLVQMRTAIDQTFKPLVDKFKPFEPFLDRIQSPEDFQTALDLREKLFGWERDPDTGRLIPATQGFAEDLAKTSLETADFLAADLLNGLTRHPATGEQVPRIDLALEAMAKDPERRAAAAQILGLVEPSSIAPTWLPSEEELARIALDPDNPTPQDKALQDVYSKLPWDERQSLKENDDPFIRKYLQREKQAQELERANQQAQELQQRQQTAREQYVQQQAQAAGNQFVETGFKEGFTEFANSIVERAKFIAPLDPQSEAARQMDPQTLAQTNQQIQQINSGVGKFIATVTAALCHPDTAWVAADFLQGMGVDAKVIQAFDHARQEFANNARSYGELNYQRTLGQNGNGQPTADLGVLQSNATRAMNRLKGQGNLIAKPLMELMSKFFEVKAGSYNSTLNGAAVARPSIQGQAFDPTTAANAQQPRGWMSKQEIEQFASR